MIEINNRTEKKLNIEAVKHCAEFFLDHYDLKKDISIAIIGDKEMKRINKRYRGKDSATDVLSFAELDVGEGADEDLLGEVILDYDFIKKQAKKSGKTADEEFTFILVHGLLHLLGMTDETEDQRKKMIKKGEEIIALMNKNNDQNKKTEKKF